MKNIKFTVVFISLLFSLNLNAQTINWGSLKKEQKHILYLNAGLDYGLVYGIGYAHQIKCKFPLVVGVEYSMPFGNKLIDDFKSKIVGQIKIIQQKHFVASAHVSGIFRRNENNFVRLLNFGSDFSGKIGYFKTKWFIASELGFDKAIVTHFKHSQSYSENFPSVVNGWYEPATGGNFHYGLETGFSIQKLDITIKAGKLLEQDFKTKPTIPFYANLGCNLKL